MGSEDGYVHFIDVQARNIPSKHSIRVFQAHSSAVRALVFTSAANVCATCGDDGDLKLWDLALSDATEPLWHCVGAHKDRIRTATAGNSEHLIVTGSYDHLVKLWDTRRSANAAAASIHLDHGHPIESILLHPNDRVIVSAGGNVVKFWDIANAARGPLATLENHNRTVSFGVRGRKHLRATDGCASSGHFALFFNAMQFFAHRRPRSANQHVSHRSWRL